MSRFLAAGGFSLATLGRTMKNPAERVELLANIAIICVSLLLGTALIQRWLLPRGPGRGGPLSPPRGTHISLPGAPEQGAEKTVVLALSKDCSSCRDSAPFYRRLAAEIPRTTRLIVAMAEARPRIESYLSAVDIPILDVWELPLSRLMLRVVPTIILVDRNGLVINSWAGQLDEGGQSAVLAAIK